MLYSLNVQSKPDEEAKPLLYSADIEKLKGKMYIITGKREGFVNSKRHPIVSFSDNRIYPYITIREEDII